MNLKKFDSTLKSALENIEVPFDASTWAALENRLDNLPAPDAVDKALRPTLERMDTSYDAGSWSALANRMDGLARVRRLRMTKAAELAIFLLLLLNLKGFFGVVESVTHPAPVKKEAPGPIAHVRSSKSKKQNLSPLTNTKTESNQTATSLAGQVFAFVQNLTSGLVSGSENQTIAAAADTEADKFQTNSNPASLLDGKNFYSHSGLVKFPAQQVLPARPVEPVLFAGIPVIMQQGFEVPKVIKASHFYAATFGSFDKNYLKQGEHSDRKNGMGGGFAIGYRKGKWGLETGIEVSQKNYKPEKINQLYLNDPVLGLAYFYINEVNADVLSVPVKATRRIAKLGKTSAHAVAGVTAHFATSKSYDFNSMHYPPIGTPLPPNADLRPLSIASFPSGKGVLENGGLNHNAYATADLGLRVEQSLGKHYVAFVEPVYQKSLGGGLGPVSSKLSTFSIQAGVLASL